MCGISIPDDDTSEFGPLPTFLICGAPKAGTTALYEYCRQHPDVLMSIPKETGFFHKNHHKGVDWLRSHFEDWGEETAIGEASVMTMPTPGAEERVADLIPNARLLFLLRDPVERAYSDYLFNVQQGWIPPDVSFGRIIRDEVDVKGYSGKALINRGLYLKHLRRFREHFRRSQMRVLLARELKHETARIVRSVYAFIGVDEDVSPGVLERTTRRRTCGSGACIGRSVLRGSPSRPFSATTDPLAQFEIKCALSFSPGRKSRR